MSRRMALGRLCQKVGMSRQNLYKARGKRRRAEVDSDLIEALVRAERRRQPRLGGRKLHHVLKDELSAAGVHIGRDRFFEVLAQKELLLERLARAPRTTNARHCLPVFRNVFKDLELTGPNQAWVGDITYVRTDEGYLYFSLLTDAWSRKIVGYHGGDTLEAEGCLLTLRRALRALPDGVKPLHHSDRGCQYCSHMYTEALSKAGLGISMTEQMHCYENALAERVNGILKQEYYLSACFRTKAQALKAIAEAVELYNTRRPHTALDFQTPEAIHRKSAA
jgi:putative transposase